MEKSIGDLKEARASLQRSVGELLGATGTLLKPLRHLEPDQRDAVVALGLLMQDCAIARRPASRLDPALVARFAKELEVISPVLGEAVLSRDPCLESNSAYVSALAKCESEGKTEDQCRAAWVPGAQAVACAMARIEATKGIIEQMLGAQMPPKPTPWPVDPRRR